MDIAGKIRLDDILSNIYFMEFVVGILVVLAIWAGKTIYSRFRQIKKEQDAISEGMKALLRNEIRKSFHYFSEKGEITLEDLEIIEGMFTQYRALGGNGVIERVMEDIRKLKIKD